MFNVRFQRLPVIFVMAIACVFSQTTLAATIHFDGLLSDGESVTAVITWSGDTTNPDPPFIGNDATIYGGPGTWTGTYGLSSYGLAGDGSVFNFAYDLSHSPLNTFLLLTFTGNPITHNITGLDANQTGIYELTPTSFGRIMEFSSYSVSVPEPTTLTLMGLGIAGMFQIRRRKPHA